MSYYKLDPIGKKRILSLALLGTTSSLFALGAEHAYLYKDPRIMGMGGANVAVGAYLFLFMLQYSYRLRQRAKNEWLEADNIKTIATSMEEFATCLIEPLKYNRAKAAIFADEIDRVAGTALLFEQKKVRSKR